MGFICAISVNCAAGAVGASALGVQPVYGVLAVNGVSFLSGLCGGFMPSGLPAPDFTPRRGRAL